MGVIQVRSRGFSRRCRIWGEKDSGRWAFPLPERRMQFRCG